MGKFTIICSLVNVIVSLFYRIAWNDSVGICNSGSSGDADDGGGDPNLKISYEVRDRELASNIRPF